MIVFLPKYLILIGFSKITFLGTDKNNSPQNSIIKKNHPTSYWIPFELAILMTCIERTTNKGTFCLSLATP